jgi:transcriptional regulator with XRE-family HTH domain
MNRLKEYRQHFGLTQAEAAEAIRRRALARGDTIVPGLDQAALGRHERGVKRPTPYYRQLYGEVYGATPAELGFCVALPCENGNYDEVVDRREFITGAAGLVASAALPALPAPTRRLGNSDLVRLRESVTRLDRLDHQHGGAAVFAMTVRTFRRLQGLVEHASYDPTTGQALRELAGQTAARAGWVAFDAGQHADARRWLLEAMHWSQLANADSVGVHAMASMARQASDQHRPREVIDLATAAQRTAGRAATPRLRSLLLAREALGHAGAGDTTSAHAALRRARVIADRAHDDDQSWLAFYGPADFTSHEYRVALMLGDLAAAEDAARTTHALEDDPFAYPRNYALGLIDLADVLVQRREIDESAAVATEAIVAAADLDSARVTRGVAAIARSLAPYRNSPGVGEFIDRARQIV